MNLSQSTPQVEIDEAEEREGEEEEVERRGDEERVPFVGREGVDELFSAPVLQRRSVTLVPVAWISVHCDHELITSMRQMGKYWPPDVIGPQNERRKSGSECTTTSALMGVKLDKVKFSSLQEGEISRNSRFQAFAVDMMKSHQVAKSGKENCSSREISLRS
jgi:hypothetical protein